MSKRKILVIDSDRNFVSFIHSLVTGIGHEVKVAKDVQDFKAIYGTFAPDVIVLEPVMGDADGLKLVDWLCEQRCEANVVVVTGHRQQLADQAKRLVTEKGGMTAEVLTKPVGARALVTALERPEH